MQGFFVEPVLPNLIPAITISVARDWQFTQQQMKQNLVQMVKCYTYAIHTCNASGKGITGTLSIGHLEGGLWGLMGVYYSPEGTTSRVNGVHCSPGGRIVRVNEVHCSPRGRIVRVVEVYCSSLCYKHLKSTVYFNSYHFLGNQTKCFEIFPKHLSIHTSSFTGSNKNFCTSVIKSRNYWKLFKFSFVWN